MTLEEAAESVLRAADDADTGHRLELIRLVDGIGTYTVTCCGETREFDDTDDAYEWIKERKLIVRAQAAQEALRTYGEQCREEGARAALEAAAKALWDKRRHLSASDCALIQELDAKEARRCNDLIERLNACLAMDAQTASDREWSELLAVAMDAKDALEAADKMAKVICDALKWPGDIDLMGMSDTFIAHQPQPSEEQDLVDRIVAWLAEDAAKTADDLRKLHRGKKLTPNQTVEWEALIAAKSGIAAAIQRGDWK